MGLFLGLWFLLEWVLEMAVVAVVGKLYVGLLFGRGRFLFFQISSLVLGVLHSLLKASLKDKSLLLLIK